MSKEYHLKAYSYTEYTSNARHTPVKVYDQNKRTMESRLVEEFLKEIPSGSKFTVADVVDYVERCYPYANRSSILHSLTSLAVKFGCSTKRVRFNKPRQIPKVLNYAGDTLTPEKTDSRKDNVVNLVLLGFVLVTFGLAVWRVIGHG